MTEQTVISQRLRSRERFLAGNGVDESVPAEIGASWRRSQLSGVPPDRLPEIRISDFDRENRLMRAARPLLDRLTNEIADSSMSLLLSDCNARILDRRVGVRNLQAKLDDVTAVPGAKYTEAAVGTNGVGTVVEIRRPLIVSGGEHFSAALRQLTCAAAPIINPITGHIEGVLDITCRSEDATNLMLPFVREAAGEICRRLCASASAVERALLHEFLTASRRSSAPVISVNGEFIIANAAAARLLEPSDHVRLWERVADAATSARGAEEVVLANGAAFEARVKPIILGGREVGALIHLARAAARLSHAPKLQTALPGLVGQSKAWRAVCDDVTHAARSSLGVAVLGDVGTGKLAVAQAVHSLRAGAGSCAVVDAAMVLADEAGWFETLGRVLAEARTVIVRHVELLSASQSALFGALCELATAGVVVTATEQWQRSVARSVLDRFPARVTLPPLRERVDDVPPLAGEFVRRYVDDHAQVRIQPEVLQALSRHGWPGNVHELEGLIRQVLVRRSCGDIAVGDLPVEYRSPAGGRALTAMEQMARDAIIRALHAEHGNKNAAAERLGISRSTLYRKIDAYRILRELPLIPSPDHARPSSQIGTPAP